jgi:hypothetical protein
MTELVIPLLSLLVPMMYLSWLGTWRRSVRLSRRLDRALAVVSRLEAEQEPAERREPPAGRRRQAPIATLLTRDAA